MIPTPSRTGRRRATPSRPRRAARGWTRRRPSRAGSSPASRGGRRRAACSRRRRGVRATSGTRASRRRKMRSIGEAAVLADAAAYRSLRFLPAQNSRSNSSLPSAARAARRSAEDHAPARDRHQQQAAITICTTRLACSTRVKIEVLVHASATALRCRAGRSGSGRPERPRIHAGDADRAFGKRHAVAHGLLGDEQRRRAALQHLDRDLEQVVQAGRMEVAGPGSRRRRR